MTRRLSLTLSMNLTLLCACDPPALEAEQDAPPPAHPNTAEDADALSVEPAPPSEAYVASNYLWKPGIVPVCWTNPAASNATYRAWVQDAVAKSWSHHAAIDFIGWGACAPGDKGVRIQIDESQPRSYVGTVSKQMDVSMHLNFTFNLWSQDCKATLEHCIRAIAVHEFGHAIGFDHEQNRPDTPKGCPKDTEASGDTVIGPWDEDSVMNYCNDEWNNGGELSAGDIAAVIQVYGPRVRRAGLSRGRDFNGDGSDDILWYQPGIGADPLWLGTDGQAFEKITAPNILGWYQTVSGDFDSDGVADMFFYAEGAAPEAIWNGRADLNFIKSTPKDTDGKTFLVQGSYTPIAGDFNGDAQDDVFWYAPGEAADFIWYGEGDNKFTSVSTTVNGHYMPVAGDFDGDGRTDVLWYRVDDAPEALWFGHPKISTQFVKTTTTKVVGSYLPFAGDFDGDGRDDVFWYAPGGSAEYLWKGRIDRTFDDTKPLTASGEVATVNGSYTAVPGDFNGDTRDDIVWYAPGSAPDHVWYATDNGRFNSVAITVNGVYAPI